MARRAVAVWPWVLSLLVTAPLLAPGFVLSYDMVFVPRQSVLPESLGLGGPLPRAVPVDAVVGLLTAVVPGQLLQKLVLVGVLGAAGAGAARLVPSTSVAAQLSAASLYVWNPYVAERLVLGHWVLLVGYATLPWLVRSAVAVRRGRPGAQATLVALLVPTALAPSPALVALIIVVPVLAVSRYPGRGRALAVSVGSWVVLNAPWWLPGVLHPGRLVDASAGVQAFAARAEGPLGALGSALTLGGVWNGDVVPASRGLPTVVVALVVVTVVAAVGLPALLRRLGGAGAGLLVAAGLGLVVALMGAWSPGSRLLAGVVSAVPGAGLLRDGQKFLAPLALAESVGFGLGVVRLSRRMTVAPRTVLRLLMVVAPLVLLPDLAWGAAGRLEPVAYPEDWAAVRQLMQSEPGGGDAVALPWQSFRRFPWNGDRVVLDPAPRWLPVSTVVDDSLHVGNITVPGDDPRAAAVGEAVASGTPLTQTLPALGIGWVVVETSTPGTVSPLALTGATQVYAGSDLQLFRLGDAVSPAWPRWWTAVVAADAAAVAVAVVALPMAVLRRSPGWRSRRC